MHTRCIPTLLVWCQIPSTILFVLLAKWSIAATQLGNMVPLSLFQLTLNSSISASNTYVLPPTEYSFFKHHFKATLGFESLQGFRSNPPAGWQFLLNVTRVSMDTAAGSKHASRLDVFFPHCPFKGAHTHTYTHTSSLFLKMYLQVSRQPGHNQQLPGSHVVDLDHLPHHRIRGHGPKHVLREGSLPPDRHHGESRVSESPCRRMW